MRRAFFGSAVPLKPDGQGRIIIPEVMRAYGSLKDKDEVVLIGDFDKVELWKSDFFEKEEMKMNSELDATFENVLNRALGSVSPSPNESGETAQAIPRCGTVRRGLTVV